MQDDQLWKAALGQLELKVSQSNFLTWFRQTRIVATKDHTAFIETENPFAYEWLSKKYHSVILEVLHSLDSDVQHVHFSISSKTDQKHPLRKNWHIIMEKKRPLALSQPASDVISPATQIKTETQPTRQVSRINPKYTFGSFVIGPSNEVAHAACLAVASRPGEAYNPLFIYGGVGLGKTHLLHAIGNFLLEANLHLRVLYVASEKFINEYVEALRERKMPQFRRNNRDVDVLIVDDVQFLAGKIKTQEELFHTFNALHGQNKQVILSSDRPPSAIPTFQERLSSRLGGGMIVDIKKPDYETRLAILKAKADQRTILVEPAALEFIAKNIQNNVRELEGALNRVLGYCEVHNQTATIEYTQAALSDLLGGPQFKTVGTRQIIEVVSAYYNIPIDDLCGKCRKKDIVRPRQVAMYLLRRENKLSFPSIGEHFGGRDHTTAMHACDKIEKLTEHDEELLQEINFLKERLYA